MMNAPLLLEALESHVAVSLAVIAALAGATLMYVSHNVHAHGTVLYVGPASGSNNGCSSPGYTSVQDAVNHAAAGTNDKLINNTISGTGYAAQQVQGGPFVLPIDTISTPDNRPKIHANDLLV